MSSIAKSNYSEINNCNCLYTAGKVLSIASGVIFILAGIYIILAANQILPNFIPLKDLYLNITGAALIFVGSASLILGIYLSTTNKSNSHEDTPLMSQKMAESEEPGFKGLRDSLPGKDFDTNLHVSPNSVKKDLDCCLSQVQMNNSKSLEEPKSVSPTLDEEHKFITQNMDIPAVEKPSEMIPSDTSLDTLSPLLDSFEKSEKKESYALWKKDVRHLILPSNYNPDKKILQFVLTDFVGGGQGNQTKNAIVFFTHYLQQYCSIFPEDQKACLLIQHFKSFFHLRDENLEEAEKRILEQLRQTGYVALSGGFSNIAEGHAIFSELCLEGDHVTFKMTNTGEGSELHPLYSEEHLEVKHRGKYYRTLVFTGITLNELQKSEFLKQLISFKNAFRKTNSDSLGLLSQNTQFVASEMCSLLINAWPGDCNVIATNPGAPQRANSCSVQSVMKKVREMYQEESEDYMHLDFWIKMQALYDYLTNENEIASQFISDSVYKISTLASKMKHLGCLSEHMFCAWEEVYNLAQKRLQEALSKEEIGFLNAALKFPQHLDETPITIVTPSDLGKIGEPLESDSQKAFVYSHRFLGEQPDYAQAAALAEPFIASDYDEMAYRLNFLRTLPNFDLFDSTQLSAEPDVLTMQKRFKKSCKKEHPALPPSFIEHPKVHNLIKISDPLILNERWWFFRTLARAIYKFIAQNPKKMETLSDSDIEAIVDAFLLNPEIEELLQELAGKPILSTQRNVFFNSLLKILQRFFYQESYTSTHIPDSFFPDLLNGWLIAYHEALKEGKISLAVRLEWMRGLNLLIETYSNEYTFDSQSKKRFLSIVHFCQRESEKLLGQLGPDYVLPKMPWTVWDRSFTNYYWYPIGQTIQNSTYGITSWNKLPAMAKFGYEVTVSNPNYQFMHKEKGQDFQKAILLFPFPLKEIPYYDLLRRSLAHFYLLADRHIGTKSGARSKYRKAEKLPTCLQPRKNECRYQQRLSIEPRALYEYSNRPGVGIGKKAHYYPETQIPALAQKYQAVEDPNKRTSISVTRVERSLPFFSEKEEFETLNSLVRDPVTALTECLKFFEGKWHKLARIDYQQAFEWMLWGGNRGELLEGVFKDHDSVLGGGMRTLLFNCIEKGYQSLLPLERKEGGIGFLFHIHLRLNQLSIEHKTEDAQLRIHDLFQCWEKLLERSKKNAFLAKALSEGAFAALPSIANVKALREDPRLLRLLATTLLLECYQGEILSTKYDQLSLTFGYHVFKELLKRSNDEEAVWEYAGRLVFEIEEPILWDCTTDKLTIGHQTFYLVDRTIEGGSGKKMSLIPKKWMENSDYRTLFGNKQLLATPFHEGERRGFWITHKKREYTLYFTGKEQRLQIFTKIEGELCQFSKSFPMIGSDNQFMNEHIFWTGQQNTYVENIETRKHVAIVQNQGLRPIHQGQVLDELFGTFAGDENYLKKIVTSVESPQHIYLWTDSKSRFISRLELPRLGLSFCRKDNKGIIRLESREYPGFFIATTQHAAFLRNFKSYLLLENAKGQKKVIIPTCSLAFGEYMPYQLDSLVTIRDDQSDRQNSLVYDLEKEQIHPELMGGAQRVSENLMLTYLYLATHQYGKALAVLKKTSLTKEVKINQHERQILESILHIKKNNQPNKDQIDLHPHAVALRLHLSQWAMELQLKEKDAIDTELGERIISDFNHYRDLHNSIGNFKLSKRGLSLLMRLFASITSAQFTQDLDKPFKLYTDIQIPLEGLWEIREAIQQRHGQACLPLSSLTAPGEEFIHNFLPYYAIAKNGNDDEKRKLKRIIASCSTDRSSLIVSQILFLVYALEKSASPSCEQMDQLLKLNKKEFDEQLTTLYTQAETSWKAKSRNLREWLTGKKEPMRIHTLKGKKPSFDPLLLVPLVEFETLNQICPGAEVQTQITAIDGAIVSEGEETKEDEIAATQYFMSWTSQKAEQARTENNLLLESEFNRLREGAELHLKDLDVNKSSFTLSRDRGAVKKVLKSYQSEINTRKSHLDKLENNILSLANNLHERRDLQLERMRVLRATFDIQTLMIAFGRRDLSGIKNINPSLADEEITSIITQVAEYAEKLCDMQKLQRCRSKLKEYSQLLKENAHEASFNAISSEYFEERKGTHVYTLSQHPGLLAFEALGNLLVRKDQFDALTTLSIGEAWTLFEARTGFGKSKVLLPLWLLLNAQIDQLTCMIVPATLFDQQQHYLQQVLQKGYQFFGFRLDFSRDSASSATDIARLLQQLKKAQRMRKPVFMSDQTAANLFLLKIKELFQQVTDEKSAEAVKMLLELRHYIKENGLVFIDEPHKVLDDSQESNYSIGKLHLFNEERLLFALQMYSHLFCVIEEKYAVECWQTADNCHLPTLTEELFRSDILPELVQEMIREKRIKVDAVALKYLLGKMEYEEQIRYEKGLQKLPDELNAMKLRVLHDQLHHYLPQTLSQNAHEHYACEDPERVRTGIPLECARNPKKGNEFCSPDQIMNFTIQANLATPFSLSYIEAYFEDLVTQTIQELDKGKHLNDIPSYQKFLLITKGMKEKAPKNFFKMDLEDIKCIRRHLSIHIEDRLQFIGCAVLPYLTRYEKKATCTPHLLAHCFKKAVGASGTLSVENLPSKFVIKADQKAISRTLITLIKKYTSKHFPPVVEIKSKKSSEILANLPIVAQQSQLYDPSVLLEIGAVMRDYPSLIDLAKDLLSAFKTSEKFDGVATFDPKGAPIVFEADSDRFIPLAVSTAKNLFWVYFQKDTTGTDNRLPPLAQALACINKYTTLTELVQGVGRLRGIHAAQDARFFLEEDSIEMRKVLKKEDHELLTLLDVIEYCTIKQAEAKGKMNVRSLHLKWNALFENLFWDHALALRQEPLKVAHDFALLENALLIEKTPDAPLTKPSLTSIQLPAKEALIEMKAQQNHKLTSIQKALQHSKTSLTKRYQLKALSDQMNQEREKMHFPNFIAIHDSLPTTQTTIAASVTLAKSDAQTAENRVLNMQGNQTGEQTADNTFESTDLWSTWTERLKNREPVPYSKEMRDYSVEKVFSHSQLRDFIPLFASETFTLAANGFITFEGDSVSNPGWITGYVKPLHYLWLQHDKNRTLTRCILIDEPEAAQKIAGANDPTEHPGTLWLVNQGIVFTQQSQTTVGLYQDATFVSLELRSKILNGDCSLDIRQQKALAQWIFPSSKDLFLKFIKTILFPLHHHLASSFDYQQLCDYLD